MSPPDRAGEIPEHGLCVPGEAASWVSLVWKATTECFWQIQTGCDAVFGKCGIVKADIKLSLKKKSIK